MNQFVMQEATVARHLDVAHIGKYFYGAFSDEEIIALNDMLLSNGQHTMLVKNMEVGHTILETFVSLIQSYKEPCWLTLDGNVPFGCIDVYQSLLESGCMKSRSVQAYVQWLCEVFYSDLLVIACSQQLLDQPWYVEFDQALQQTRLYDHMPIVQMLDIQYQ